MKINYAKTREMILGPLANCPPDLLSHSSTDEASIERVKCFKLLGIYLSNDLNWQAHICLINFKSATRLHFLRNLEKSGLNPDHLLRFYLSVIRPVLEYCSVVWHHGLTNNQCQILEAIQRRALRIVFTDTAAVCHTFLLWAMPKFHLFTLAVKKPINNFSNPCLTLPPVFCPSSLHPETALLLPD